MEISTSDGYRIVKFNITGISGAETIGGYKLRFHTSIEAPSWEGRNIDGVYARDPRVKLQLAGKDVATGLPEKHLSFLPRNHEYKSTTSFEFFLHAQQMEGIEKIRMGDGLSFELNLLYEFGDQYNTFFPGSNTTTLRVSQSDWLDVIKSMNYRHYMLLEIPTLSGENRDSKPPVSCLKTARNLIFSGHYTQAVVECRKALESVVSTQERSKAKKAFCSNGGNGAQEMSKNARITALTGCLYHLMNLSAHHECGGENIFNRSEAIMIYGSTASLIASCSAD